MKLQNRFSYQDNYKSNTTKIYRFDYYLMNHNYDLINGNYDLLNGNYEKLITPLRRYLIILKTRSLDDMVTEKAKEPVWKQKGLKGPAWKELGYKKPGRVRKYAKKNEAHNVYNKKMPAKRVTPEEANHINWLREKKLTHDQVIKRLQTQEVIPKDQKELESDERLKDILRVLNVIKKDKPMVFDQIDQSLIHQSLRMHRTDLGKVLEKLTSLGFIIEEGKWPNNTFRSIY